MFIIEVFYAIGVGTAVILAIAGIYDLFQEWKR